jgi:hypothetical protein
MNVLATKFLIIWVGVRHAMTTLNQQEIGDRVMLTIVKLILSLERMELAKSVQNIRELKEMEKIQEQPKCVVPTDV